MSSKVLVLFESEVGSRPVVECLSLAGYFVIVSRNYSEAMAIVKSQPVDLIISDVHLENGGSVFDFLSWIRHNQLTKNTPFVLFSLEPTAMAKVVEHGVKIAARALKASKFISMEIFDGEELCQQIVSILSRGNDLKPSKILQKREGNHDS